MKRLVSILILSASAFIQLSAQGLSSLILPKNTEELGMGNVSPVFVHHENDFGANVSYSNWSPEVLGNSLIGTSIFYKLTDALELDLEFQQNSGQSYSVTDETGIANKQFTPKDFLGGLGASYKVNDNFEVGLKGRFLSASLGEGLSESAVGIDIGANYVSNGITAGLGACNLGSEVGMAKADVLYESETGLKAGAEADILFNGGLMASLGAEYGIKDIAFIRCGYHFGDNPLAIPSFVSLGLGLKYAGVSFDAAYLLASEALGGTLMFGLGYSF